MSWRRLTRTIERHQRIFRLAIQLFQIAREDFVRLHAILNAFQVRLQLGRALLRQQVSHPVLIPLDPQQFPLAKKGEVLGNFSSRIDWKWQTLGAAFGVIGCRCVRDANAVAARNISRRRLIELQPALLSPRYRGQEVPQRRKKSSPAPTL